ncbi:DNA translocase FtsK [Microvirga zambiensis]|uniref:DNA translocase FtsK n=1 Tax=Microvirga zambiensis TaxID=1402137 RepID=UPI001FE858E1|nr:DNA translocase FtsK [Microvirga zambiensis]
MHSTRKPPFAPPPLPGEDNAREITNVVRLQKARRGAENDPVQDTGEPPWRQAFVLAEGVKATRTPDRIIRARNGHPEPVTSGHEESVPEADAAIGKPVRSVIGEEATEAHEPTIRSQIAELRSALAAEDSVSERLTRLADKEAALADESGGEAAGGPRFMIETATRLPFSPQAPEPVGLRRQEQSQEIQLRPTATSFSLVSAAVSFSWQGNSYGLASTRPTETLDALPARFSDELVFPDSGLTSDAAYGGGSDSIEAIEPENSTTVDASRPSEPSPESIATTDITAEAAPPAGTVTSVPGSIEAEIDLSYLALFDDLVPTTVKTPPTGEVALQLWTEPLVDPAPYAAIVPARERGEQLPMPDAADNQDLAAAPRAESLQEAGPIVDLPKVAPSTWGHPILLPATVVDWSYQKPDIGFLAEPPDREGPELTEDILEETAGRLERVIRDFGVKGEVIHVHPGPVVTLYEFEPAPGIKSARVIALSEDIARSMSAVSARVAVIPGRNAIGIELPNETRETVFLRELLASEDFEVSKHKLPLCLGKTIGGEPVIADLARMPHLLVAGTTGSGKSVAINTMILSLLFRFTPEECRLIMVDPKMLELSVYDGIPHLLTPVVTDPKKAIIALRWAVREMEDRYKKMAKLGVRNIDGFNARVVEAKAKGEVITRSIQTGFDKATGELTYTEEVMDLTSLPYIVVIVDEMADLMMVAGKEIEGAIQRLAQMARAAGIHVILATQRPSVDVITGTIKANFPTRISFQVTSKIDSRTILGEMGAEQLLGQGDMLHMQGGGRIARVHGPFVSDLEVERVVAHLKRQAKPIYVEAVTAEDEEMEPEETPVFDESEIELGSGELFDQAVSIVLRHKKASTSYIQRRLQIGYNRAASLMERMEKEGIVGPANHAGKREIFIGTGGADED